MKIAMPGLYLVEESFTLKFSTTEHQETFFSGRVLHVDESDIDQEAETVILSGFVNEAQPWEFPVVRLIKETDTPFYGVAQLNKNMGRERRDYTNINPHEAESQFNLIKEELEETGEALMDLLNELPGSADRFMPFQEVRDGICDILVTTYGLAYILSINPHADMQVVRDSNNSKFCQTYEEACETCDHYAGIEIQTYISDTSDGRWAVRTREFEQTDTSGKIWPANKLCKSVNFKAPDWLANNNVNGMWIFEDSDL